MYRPILALLIVICSTSSAQQIRWTQTAGPPGGLVYALHASAEHLFASTGVLYRSTNGGDHWTKDSPVEATDNANSRVHTIVTDSSGRAVAATYDYVYVSQTAGAPWIRHAIAPGYPRAIAVSSDNALFVQTQSLRRITGDTVMSVADLGEDSYNVTTFTAGRNGVMYAIADTTRVYRSTDNGVSWRFASVIDSSKPSVYGMMELSNGSVLVLTSRGLYVSSDEAGSWRADTSSIRERKVFAAVEHNGALYVGTYLFGVFRSTDVGSTWTELNNGFDNPTITDLASTHDGRLLAGTYQGVYSSTDGGGTWRFTNDGIAANAIQAMCMTHDDRLLVGTSSGLFATSDRGASWRTINYGLNERDVRSIVTDSSGSLYALTSTPSIFTSTNGGELWTRVGPVADFRYASRLTLGPDGRLFAAAMQANGEASIVSSSDRGATWIVARGVRDFRTFAMASDGELIAVAAAGDVYRSSGRGTAWEVVSNGRLTNSLWWAAADGRGRAYIAASGGIFRSSDDGHTWYADDVAPIRGDCYSIGASPTGYVLTYCSGETYASFDGGESFQPSSSGMSGLATWGYAFARDGSVYAATYAGVYRGELVASSVHADASKAAHAIHISPHPIRGRARLEIANPGLAHVTVTLHSMFGEGVSTLYDGAAAGTLALPLDDLAPGTYACRVRRGEDVVTRLFVVE